MSECASRSLAFEPECQRWQQTTKKSPGKYCMPPRWERLRGNSAPTRSWRVLSGFSWIHPKAAVDQGLLKLCDLKFFVRKLQTNNAWKYRLTENVKDRIILELVNAT